MLVFTFIIYKWFFLLGASDKTARMGFFFWTHLILIASSQGLKFSVPINKQMKLLFYLIIKKFIRVRWLAFNDKIVRITRRVHHKIYGLRVSEVYHFQINLTDMLHRSMKLIESMKLSGCINYILYFWITKNNIHYNKVLFHTVPCY